MPKLRAATAVAASAAKQRQATAAPAAATGKGKRAKAKAATAQAAERAPGEQRFYLMKSEPGNFSIQELKRRKQRKAPDGSTLGAQVEPWDGVRNYAARNLMQEMKVGDKAFFYHSNAKPPAIVGRVEVVREAYVDYTAFDRKEKYFDAKSSAESPRWFMVDVKLECIYKEPVGLPMLKRFKDTSLLGMDLFTKGRLSVGRVPKDCFEFIESKLAK